MWLTQQRHSYFIVGSIECNSSQTLSNTDSIVWEHICCFSHVIIIRDLCISYCEYQLISFHYSIDCQHIHYLAFASPPSSLHKTGTLISHSQVYLSWLDQTWSPVQHSVADYPLHHTNGYHHINTLSTAATYCSTCQDTVSQHQALCVGHLDSVSLC